MTLPLDSTTTLPLAFKTLRLPTMARCWKELTAEASANQWSHERLLNVLCEQELKERQERRMVSRLAASRLPPGKRLDNFDFGVVPSIRKSHIESLLTGEWLRAGGNILAFGGTGSGKSHCTAGMGYGLIETGYTVIFYRTSDLVQRLQAARRDLRFRHCCPNWTVLMC